MQTLGEVQNELVELLKTFSAEQLDFVAQRILHKKDNEAAEAAGLDINTVYHWANKQDVNRAVILAKLDTVQVAREKLRRLTPKAVDVLDDEMEKGRKRRLDAARDVLDRTGIESTKNVDITSGGDTLTFVVKRDDGRDAGD